MEGSILLKQEAHCLITATAPCSGMGEECWSRWDLRARSSPNSLGTRAAGQHIPQKGAIHVPPEVSPCFNILADQ